jgi:serine/threonine-protein phosphatase 2A regulatory subunit B'
MSRRTGAVTPSGAAGSKVGKAPVKGKRPGSGVGDCNQLLKDATPADRPNLFMSKLRLCSKPYDFSDLEGEPAAKEKKRATLLEICEFINAPAKICCLVSENVLAALFSMIITNLMTLNEPTTNGVEMQQGSEEEEPALFCEQAYAHMELVMEILLRLVTKGDTDAKMMKKHLNTEFVSAVLGCFTSRDPRLREYLKTILHRVYGRFMAYRLFIRKAIIDIFFQFTYEDPRHAGIGELLEILGSIINGFALPLKEEHRQFLERSLLPLHKPANVAAYHPQLCYCIVQFVEKEESLSEVIMSKLLKWWPVTNSAKQVLFLGEIEEIVEIIQEEQFATIMIPLFERVAKCLLSSHFQVAERALCLWQSPQMLENIRKYRADIIPIVHPALMANSNHWHASVQSLGEQVLELYNDMDPNLMKKCLRDYKENLAAKEALATEKKAKWQAIEEMAAANRG